MVRGNKGREGGIGWEGKKETRSEREWSKKGFGETAEEGRTKRKRASGE